MKYVSAALMLVLIWGLVDLARHLWPPKGSNPDDYLARTFLPILLYFLAAVAALGALAMLAGV